MQVFPDIQLLKIQIQEIPAQVLDFFENDEDHNLPIWCGNDAQRNYRITCERDQKIYEKSLLQKVLAVKPR